METNHNPKHILVVDDELSVRTTIRLVLSWEGYRVTEAPDGPAALELFAHDHFDLVITDYQMPGMRGHELASRVKQRFPTRPVLMLTAYLGDALTDFRAVDAFLHKPFDLPIFRQTVARLLKD
jgi:two-component system response regulator (stage 0 sporulation protein F)